MVMGYPSDVTDDDWKLIEKYFERASKRGAVPKHNKREIVNAILYVARGGIQWRMLPTDFPPWKTVYDHYSNWCMLGVWQKALDDLTVLHRKMLGRNEKPSYGIIDSQSTKTQYASEDRGYDGGKKNQGSKKTYCR